MSNDLENLLARARETYPAPDDAATRQARRVFVASARPSWRRRSHPRLLAPRVAAAAAAFAVCVGGAFGAGFSVGSNGSSTPTTASPSAGPGFLPATGWSVAQTGLTAPPQGPTAIAANVPLAPEDRGLDRPPSATAERLGPEGVLFYTIFVPSGQVAAVDRQFPKRDLPLRLPDAKPGGLEGLASAGESLRLAAQTGGYDIDVLIIFGAKKPSLTVRADAEQELARLVVPDCPTGAAEADASDRAAAEAFLLQWLRGRYVGRASDLDGAKPRGYIVGDDAAPHGAAAEAQCGKSIDGKLIEVDVNVAKAAQATVGPFPLAYFVFKTDHGFTVWRQT